MITRELEMVEVSREKTLDELYEIRTRLNELLAIGHDTGSQQVMEVSQEFDRKNVDLVRIVLGLEVALVN